MDETEQLSRVIELEKKLWTSKDSPWDMYIDQIKSILNDILIQNPNSCAALINLGAMYSNAADYLKAKEVLLKAKELNCQDKNLFLNLGYVSVYLREPRDVYLAYFQTAKSKDPSRYTFEAYFDPHAQ